jgi:hypothetical protein
VIAFDANRLWVLDPATGRNRTARVDLAETERNTAAADNADGLPVLIRGAAFWADVSTFLNLGTAMLALRDDLSRLWRRPRGGAIGGRRPTIGMPVVASLQALIAMNVAGSTTEVVHYDGRRGTNGWTQQYVHKPSPQPPGPGPGGPGPGPGGPGPGPGDSEPGGEPDRPGDPPDRDFHDDAWDRIEGRIIGEVAVVRDAGQIHALRVGDGMKLWTYESATPVASIEVTGAGVLVGADVVYGLSLADGKRLWAGGPRGARLAAAGVDRAVAASEDEVALLRTDGQVIWKERLPNDLTHAMTEQVTVEGDVAYVVFKPRDHGSPLEADVAAYRL